MTCGNGRVEIEHTSEKWENLGAGPERTTPNQPTHHSDITGRGYAVDFTHARPICTDSRAARHTGGTQLPHIKLNWARERLALRQSGLVYYMERADGAVKIGCTSNYPQRRQALVHQHGPLRLVAWEPGYDAVEQQRHQQFAHLRIDPVAEWFHVDAELHDHLLSLLAVL